MSLSFWQILLVALLFLMLFGRGRITSLMTDLAGGIKSFKQGLQDDEGASEQKSATIDTSHKPMG